MKRTIIKIDENLCNGCGACVQGCHEGALQMIDGKARIISELYCDGLGACIGECPVGAISLEEREAEPYNEDAVMEKMIPKGEKTILAHFLHLKNHNENEYLKQGIDYLKRHNINIDLSALADKKDVSVPKHFTGCPGQKEKFFEAPQTAETSEQPSQLRQWPVQLHLLNPEAAYFKGADVVLAADCTAYAYGGFHNKFLKNRILAIACPKLDINQDIYVEKLTAMINRAEINTLTVVIMEVPCCGGLLHIAKKAVEQADRKIPVKKIIIGIQGDIVKEEWM